MSDKTTPKLETTRAQRMRLRELSIPDRDDYDRTVLELLRDFDRMLVALGHYPDGLTERDHIAHDMRAGRFPQRSSIETFTRERADGQ